MNSFSQSHQLWNEVNLFLKSSGTGTGTGAGVGATGGATISHTVSEGNITELIDLFRKSESILINPNPLKRSPPNLNDR